MDIEFPDAGTFDVEVTATEIRITPAKGTKGESRVVQRTDVDDVNDDTKE